MGKRPSVACGVSNETNRLFTRMVCTVIQLFVYTFSRASASRRFCCSSRAASDFFARSAFSVSCCGDGGDGVGSSGDGGGGGGGVCIWGHVRVCAGLRRHARQE